MKKYYIGLLVLLAATVGLTIYVIALGIQTRQDVKTEKSAQEISTKLNDYVSKNNKIPADLKEAGVTDAPDTITYTKKSTKEYEFCATYKAAKSYGSGDITGVLTSAAMQRAASAGASDSSSDYTASYLYPTYNYKKGQNCQTIKPYFTSSSPTIDDYCSSTSKYYSLYKDFCATTEPIVN